MAQRASNVNPAKSPRQIERDIDETRSEMSETLDALSDRLDPDQLKERAKREAKDFLSGPASDMGSTLLDTVKENPVPALAAALSIGWLVVKSGESEQDRRFEDDYYRRYGRYPAPGYARYARRTGRYREFYDTDYDAEYDTGYSADYDTDGSGRSLGDQASDKASQAKRKAADAKDKVQDKAHDLADQASDQAHDLAADARRYGRRAENWMERQMRENPMLVGAVALAGGALVGLSVPETDQEDEWMGRQSDRLKARAKDAAEEKLNQAKQVAEETAEEAKSKAKDVAESAKEEAKDVAGTAKNEAKKKDLDKAANVSHIQHRVEVVLIQRGVVGRRGVRHGDAGEEDGKGEGEQGKR